MQLNTKLFPHMVLTSLTTRLKADNFLNPSVQTFEDDDPTTMAKHMINKMQLIAKMHGEVVENVNHAQVKQKWAYGAWKGKQMFLGFKEGETYVKMKKHGKKKSLTSNQEGPFLFMKYLDGNGYFDQDEKGRIYVVKDKEEQLQDRFWRDLQVFHVAP